MDFWRRFPMMWEQPIHWAFGHAFCFNHHVAAACRDED
jgi:hypothetical protein